MADLIERVFALASEIRYVAVYLDGQVYILDNLTSRVLPQEQVTQYVPYYSVNETTRWAHVPPAATMLSERAQPMTPGAEAN